jgi:hypothetical protein
MAPTTHWNAMLNRRSALVVLPLCAAAAAQAAGSPGKVSTDERVQLQSAMQMHIDRTTVAGSYPVLNLATGKVRQLHPAAAHPMMLRLGDYYVLCADFRDDAGKAVNVDFYLARNDRKFTVFQVEVANRAPLDGLVKEGLARMLE